MKDLLNVCQQNKPKFADALLNYSDIDEKTMIRFLDMAMPSVSVYSYKSRIMFNLLSTVVTESEEAFAYLVFENNFERWIYQAEQKVSEEDSTVTTQTFDGQSEIPKALYQKEVKKRKDNIDTVGKWTDEGLTRFNELLVLVREKRQGRGAFEELLHRTYLTMEHGDDYDKKVQKNRNESNTTSRKKKRVKVMNVLNVAEL